MGSAMEYYMAYAAPATPAPNFSSATQGAIYVAPSTPVINYTPINANYSLVSGGVAYVSPTSAPQPIYSVPPIRPVLQFSPVAYTPPKPVEVAPQQLYSAPPLVVQHAATQQTIYAGSSLQEARKMEVADAAVRLKIPSESAKTSFRPLTKEERDGKGKPIGQVVEKSWNAYYGDIVKIRTVSGKEIWWSERWRSDAVLGAASERKPSVSESLSYASTSPRISQEQMNEVYEKVGVGETFSDQSGQVFKRTALDEVMRVSTPLPESPEEVAKQKEETKWFLGAAPASLGELKGIGLGITSVFSTAAVNAKYQEVGGYKMLLGGETRGQSLTAEATSKALNAEYLRNNLFPAPQTTTEFSMSPTGAVFATTTTKDVFQGGKTVVKGGEAADALLYSSIVGATGQNRKDLETFYATGQKAREEEAVADQISQSDVFTKTIFGLGSAFTPENPFLIRSVAAIIQGKTEEREAIIRDTAKYIYRTDTGGKFDNLLQPIIESPFTQAGVAAGVGTGIGGLLSFGASSGGAVSTVSSAAIRASQHPFTGGVFIGSAGVGLSASAYEMKTGQKVSSEGQLLEGAWAGLTTPEITGTLGGAVVVGAAGFEGYSRAIKAVAPTLPPLKDRITINTESVAGFKRLYFKTGDKSTTLLGITEKGTLITGRIPTAKEMPSLLKDIPAPSMLKGPSVAAETSFWREAAADKTFLKDVGYSANEIGKVRAAMKVTGELSSVQQTVVGKFPKETKTMKENVFSAVKENLLREQKAGNPIESIWRRMTGTNEPIAEIYGSSAAEAQTRPGSPSRPAGDLEVQLKTSFKNQAEAFAIRQASVMNKAAGKELYSVKGNTVFETSTGKTALDIHYQNEPDAQAVISGYKLGQRVPTENVVVEGQPTQSLRGHVLDKGTASVQLWKTKAGELVFEPAGYRPKDVADFYFRGTELTEQAFASGQLSPVKRAETLAALEAFKGSKWLTSGISEGYAAYEPSFGVSFGNAPSLGALGIVPNPISVSPSKSASLSKSISAFVSPPSAKSASISSLLEISTSSGKSSSSSILSSSASSGSLSQLLSGSSPVSSAAPSSLSQSLSISKPSSSKSSASSQLSSSSFGSSPSSASSASSFSSASSPSSPSSPLKSVSSSFIGGFPFVLGASSRVRGRRGGRRGQRTEYKPDLTSLAFKIIGKIPKGTLSGLELRPLPLGKVARTAKAPRLARMAGLGRPLKMKKFRFKPLKL